jgi:hypothetical protein
MTRLAAGFVAVSLREIGPRATLSALLTPIPLAKLKLKTTLYGRAGHNRVFCFY